jgi:hypothetical protein
MRKLPGRLIAEYVRVLVGKIYPEIRAIVGQYFPEEKKLLTRCYLDREPNEDDYEMLNVVAAELISGPCSEYIAEAEVECVCSDKRFKDIETLDGFIYARREWS